MRLLIHQALKDVRVLGWLVLTWILVMVVFQGVNVYAALTPILPATPDKAGSGEAIAYAYSAIEALVVGLFAVIAVLVVQTDPAVGTTAFWFTRPVSTSTLVASKFVVAGSVLVVLPLLADVLAIMAGGLRFGDALHVLPSTLAIQIAWLMPLLALAAISVNLAQFAVAALVEFLLFVGCAVFLRGAMRSGAAVVVGWPNGPLPVWVFVAALVLLALAVLVYAYRVRRLRPAAALAIVVPVVLVGLLSAWPANVLSWPFDRLDSRLTATALPGSFRIEPARAWDPRMGWIVVSESRRISGAFSCSNVPSGQVVTSSTVRVWIEYPGETIDVRLDSTQGAPASAAVDGRVRALEHALGDARMADAPLPPRLQPGFSGTLPTGAYDRHASQSGVLHADLSVTLTEESAAAATVMLVGATYRGAGRSGTITGVAEAPDGLAMSVAETRLRLPNWSDEREAIPAVMYAVRNPRIGLAGLSQRATESVVVHADAPPIPVPAHLSGSRVTFEFPSPEGIAPADWMHGAELVIVESRYLGRTNLHVTTPNFVLASLGNGSLAAQRNGR